MPSPTVMPSLTSFLRPRRLALAAGAVGAVSFGLAYRFALQYRARVGLPTRSPVEGSPGDYGLAFESVEIPGGDARLAAWYVPAEKSGRRKTGLEARPGIVIVHGWESNRGRSIAHIRYLHAAGFHCLAIDARGHGDNPPEDLPVNVPEFGEDAAAAARWLAARPEVSAVGLARPFDGRRRGDRGRRRRAGRSGCRRHLVAGRPGADDQHGPSRWPS